MNEEEQEALKVLKGLEFDDYDWYVKTDKIEGHADEVVEEVEKAMQRILNLIDKQQEKILELKQFKEEVIDIIKYADDTAESTYWNIRKLIEKGE